MEEIKVAHINDLKEGMGKVVTANGKPIALFLVDGKCYAIDNTCVHRGGPLGEGFLDKNIVTCPWHGWEYDITTGQCTIAGAKVHSYKVEVKGEDVFVKV